MPGAMGGKTYVILDRDGQETIISTQNFDSEQARDAAIRSWHARRDRTWQADGCPVCQGRHPDHRDTIRPAGHRDPWHVPEGKIILFSGSRQVDLWQPDPGGDLKTGRTGCFLRIPGYSWNSCGRELRGRRCRYRGESATGISTKKVTEDEILWLPVEKISGNKNRTGRFLPYSRDFVVESPTLV